MHYVCTVCLFTSVVVHSDVHTILAYIGYAFVMYLKGAVVKIPCCLYAWITLVVKVFVFLAITPDPQYMIMRHVHLVAEPCNL